MTTHELQALKLRTMKALSVGATIANANTIILELIETLQTTRSPGLVVSPIKVEEPKVEEPKVEEPKVEEPKVVPKTSSHQRRRR